ncbi:hypothetical protein FACS189451_07650 [Bacteroidia bacterium]|nr:hypothetical protein FACS189451_07650 [Bacteroidia bacterium]
MYYLHPVRSLQDTVFVHWQSEECFGPPHETNAAGDIAAIASTFSTDMLDNESLFESKFIFQVTTVAIANTAMPLKIFFFIN